MGNGKVGLLGQVRAKPTAEDAQRQILKDQGDWLKEANVDFLLPSARDAVLGSAGVTTAAGLAKKGAARAIGSAALRVVATPALPLIYGASLLGHYAGAYDQNRHGKLASQAFSRRNGMYNPYDDI